MIDHNQIQELLPWFINGTLNEVEHEAVSAHVDSCEICRLEINSLIHIASLFDSAQDSRQVAPALVNEANLQDFLDALPSQTPSRNPKSSSRNRYLATYAVACTFLVSAILTFNLLNPAVTYRTLSAPQSVIGNPAGVIQIVFKPDATEQVIRSVLHGDQRSVLEGPSKLGVYRVALSAGDNPEVHLARLRMNPDILFVEAELSE